MTARRMPNRTAHETIAMQRMAVRSEEWWEYRPAQAVMTPDGILGTVIAVHDGPVPGTEEYQVELTGGLGGGAYTASQLRPVPAATAVLQTAAVDYPELAQVLVDEPDPALEQRMASGKPWEDDEDSSSDGEDGDSSKDSSGKNDSDDDEDEDGKDKDDKDEDTDEKDNPFDRFSSLVTRAAADIDFRFQITAAWRDIVAKAKRIRAEGGVRVTMASDGLVVGEVKGDNHVYETGLQRLPGRTSVQSWSCGCIWGAYHWGADDDFSRFAGRMCSHALALTYEAQSRGMFGRDVEEDSEKPSWVPRNIVVRYDIDDRRNDLARSSALAQPNISPLRAVASAVVAAGAAADEVILVLSTIGVTASVTSPFGEPGGEAVMAPKMPGATSPHRSEENPASAGPLVGGDPAGWSQALPGTLDDRLGFRAEAALFEPGGTEATLNDTPQAALPSTDGEAIPSDDEALSPQVLGVAKRALKDFSPSERRELINEGDDGTRARNLGDLQIQGTHYAALEEQLASEGAIDLFG